MKQISWLVCVALCGLPVICGCGGNEGNRPKYKAGGVALFEDGQPVTGLDVLFQPTKAGAALARGELDAQGKFRLSTLEKDDGAEAGTYKVYFSTSMPRMDSVPSATEVPKVPPKPVEPERIVAKDHVSALTTPFTVEIKADGDNSDIQLKGVKRAAAD